MLVSEKFIVDKYLGISYSHKGRSLEGLDCYGLIISIYKDMGFDLFDIEDYDTNWSFKGKNLMLKNYHRQWEKVNKPEYLDVALFKGKYGVCHGGVILKEGKLIHCCRQGTIVVRLGNGQYGKYSLDGYYHLKARNGSS